MSIPKLTETVLVQIELAGWGTNSAKLKGTSAYEVGI